MRLIVTLISLIVLASCGSTGGNVRNGDQVSPDKIPDENTVKISYVRWNQDPQTREWKGQYYVMLSNSWRERYGSWYDTSGSTVKDPWRRVFRTPFLNEHVKDSIMIRLMEKIRAAGFDQLPETDPKSVSLKDLMELPSSRDPNRIKVYRILSIKRGKYSRTVVFADLLGSGYIPKVRAQAQAFVDAEVAVIRSPAAAYAIQVSKGTEPFKPRRRDD